jgi:hydroxylamine reductase
MFCYQCEQTQDGTGCTTIGVCGKTPETAALQDLSIFLLRRLALYMHLAMESGVKPRDLIDYHEFATEVLYATLTNVNFDPERFRAWNKKLLKNIEEVKNIYEKNAKNPIKIEWIEPNPQEDNTGVKNSWKSKMLNEDTAALHELLQYGLKGAAAYGKEGSVSGRVSDEVIQFYAEAMAFLSDAKNGPFSEKAKDPNEVLNMALKLGEKNITILSDLSQGHKDLFGVPTPAQVEVNPVKGKCILVSGHDLSQLHLILQQTEGKGINVYTHGEMLPAHGYPKLKQYKHLVGNYGSAWQVQKMEFPNFPGPIVVTTNCILEPRPSYKDRIYTTGVVGVSGVKHISNGDYSEVIKQALEMEGFTDENLKKHNRRTFKPITVGFGHDVVLSLADTIINAIKIGKIKRFFLIGGCDGSESERSYYKDLATKLPNDTIILTLGCAKYRFHKAMDYGAITVPKAPGSNETIDIPRLLDMGQCNDSYSAIRVAMALSDALKTDINSLPISYAISWFEQKAVVVFLTMLHLGVKNIRLGPNLPAFVPPSLLKFLNEKLNLSPNGDVDADLAMYMKGQ